ncbi:hypothetical protein CC80DRAFT_356930, partial [Byssothecium circinans]
STQYSYKTLPTGKYLCDPILNPQSYEDPLPCTLHACVFEGAPLFEALSYVCRSSDKVYTLVCDEKAMPITENPFHASRQIRLPAKLRRLWAHSCCINQEGLQEQGRQVCFLHEIY